jgi:hypothetical protein
MNDFGRKAYENEDKYTQINKMNTSIYSRGGQTAGSKENIF